MRCALSAVLFGATACNAVFGLDPVGEAPATDAAIVDVPIDDGDARDAGDADGPAADAGDASIPADASLCITDELDGTALGPHWSGMIGPAPVYDVSGSRLLLTESPIASTPSQPSNSWIFDLDTDKGNQLVWPRAIGVADFTLEAELAWSSTTDERTLAGVGVTNALGTLVAHVGVYDDTSVAPGAATARLWVPGGFDLVNGLNPVEPGAAQVRIQRRSGQATISVDGVTLLTGAMPSPVAHIVIVYVRQKLGTVTYIFGALEVRWVRICP